jgi:SAM-dependent methyltransferase
VALTTDLYGHLAPRLRIVPSDVVAHLRATPGTYDVLYSVFGAVCFTDPRRLLPAVAQALKPGGRLVFSTLGVFLNGEPAEREVRHADIPAKTPTGEPTTMRRWVLHQNVWQKALDQAGFTHVQAEPLPGGHSRPTPGTLLVIAHRAS